jgi:hypothetical protein
MPEVLTRAGDATATLSKSRFDRQIGRLFCDLEMLRNTK